MSTIDDLVKIKTADELKTTILQLLSSKGYSATDWESGSESRVLVETESETLRDVWSTLNQIAKGGYLDTATGDWLTLLAKSQYDIDRLQPITAVGTASLSVASGAGPYTYNAGDVIASDGNANHLFRNSTNVTVTSAAPVNLQMVADKPGADYNIAINTLNILNTPAPGLSINNPGQAYPAVLSSSELTGPFVLTGKNLLLQLRVGLVVINQTLTFASDVATLSLLPTAINTLIAATPLNGKVTSSVSGDTLQIQTIGTGEQQVLTLFQTGTANVTLGFSSNLDSVATGSTKWLSTYGVDEEKDETLISRCKSKWATIGAGTRDAYIYWSKVADPFVQKVVVFSNLFNGMPKAGAVSIYIAGIGGSLSSLTVLNVYNYILPKMPIMSSLYVASAVAVATPMSITIKISSAKNNLATKNAVVNAINSYFANLDIAERAYLSKIIGAAVEVDGIIDVKITSPTNDIVPAKNQLLIGPVITYNYIVV